MSTLFPFALTPIPHLHWNVKYSYKTASINVLGKHR